MRIIHGIPNMLSSLPAKIIKAFKSGKYLPGGEIPLESATCTSQSNRRNAAPLCAIDATMFQEAIYQILDTQEYGKVYHWGV
jgi:hypothetical protein